MARKKSSSEDPMPVAEETPKSPVVAWSMTGDLDPNKALHTAVKDGAIVGVVDCRRMVAKVNVPGQGDWLTVDSVAEGKALVMSKV